MLRRHTGNATATIPEFIETYRNLLRIIMSCQSTTETPNFNSRGKHHRQRSADTRHSALQHRVLSHFTRTSSAQRCRRTQRRSRCAIRVFQTSTQTRRQAGDRKNSRGRLIRPCSHKNTIEFGRTTPTLIPCRCCTEPSKIPSPPRANLLYSKRR